VDRAYRIGQRRDVLVYRLVTCSTVEEKIYSRQLLKRSLGNTLEGTGEDGELAHSKRLFSRKDLKNLFRLSDPSASVVCEQLRRATERLVAELLSAEARKPTFGGTLRAHMASLRESGVAGFTYHDLVGKLTEKELQASEFVNRQVQQAEIALNTPSRGDGGGGGGGFAGGGGRPGPQRVKLADFGGTQSAEALKQQQLMEAHRAKEAARRRRQRDDSFVVVEDSDGDESFAMSTGSAEHSALHRTVSSPPSEFTDEEVWHDLPDAIKEDLRVQSARKPQQTHQRIPLDDSDDTLTAEALGDAFGSTPRENAQAEPRASEPEPELSDDLEELGSMMGGLGVADRSVGSDASDEELPFAPRTGKPRNLIVLSSESEGEESDLVLSDSEDEPSVLDTDAAAAGGGQQPQPEPEPEPEPHALADDGVPAGSEIDESVWRELPQDIKDEIRAELQAEEAPSAEDPEQSIDTSETAESWDAGWPRLAPTSSLPQGETYEELLALDDQTEAEGLPPNEVARLTAEQTVNTDRLQTRLGGPNAFSHRWRCVPAHAGAAPSFRRQRRGQV